MKFLHVTINVLLILSLVILVKGYRSQIVELEHQVADEKAREKRISEQLVKTGKALRAAESRLDKDTGEVSITMKDNYVHCNSDNCKYIPLISINEKKYESWAQREP